MFVRLRRGLGIALAVTVCFSTVPEISAQPGPEPTATQGAGGSGRIGFVDIDKITSKAKQHVAAMDDLSAEVRRIQKDLQTRIDKIRDLERDIEKNRGVVSNDEINRKQQEIKRLRNELDTLEVKYKREMQRLDETVFEPLVRKIGYAIEDVAQEQGYDLVLRGELLFYGSDSVNLTDAVIEKLNMGSDDTTGTRSGSTAKRNQETPSRVERAVKEEAQGSGREGAGARSGRVRPVDRQEER